MGVAASCSGGGGEVALHRRPNREMTVLPAQITSCSFLRVTEVGSGFCM